MELLGASLSAWWRHLPVFVVLAALVVVPVHPVAETVVATTVRCAVLSFTALAATLLFCDLRARTEEFCSPIG